MAVDFYRHSLKFSDSELIGNVLNTPYLTSGSIGISVEEKLKDFFSINEALLVNSWTNGAVATLLALGIKHEDEVIVPAQTFIATANCVQLIGAKPVFCDVDAETLLIDFNLVQKKITPKTRAVIAVHLYGRMCDIHQLRLSLNKIGRSDIYIIEDAAHCFEGSLNGLKPGSFSNAAIFSFYATKNVTCGEGGAIITNDLDLANAIRVTRLHGMSASAIDRFKTGSYRHWDMERLGVKANLPDILAALLPPQIAEIKEKLSIRTSIANKYLSAFKGTRIRVPKLIKDCIDAKHLFTINVPAEVRDKSLLLLISAGIGCTVNYRAVPTTTYYKSIIEDASERSFPVSIGWGEGTISLPLYPSMTVQQVDEVINAVEKYIAPLCVKRNDKNLGINL